jgi:methionyl-tRNA synthetase
VSRPAERSGGWGIPVPGDPEQVVYVWFDALANYISALGYGTGAGDYRRWWVDSDRRVHVIGKGILRFHAAYWPAFLLSAGEPLPTDVLVHEYLTVDGRKISKSSGSTVEPARLVERFGTDALRWWLLRDVNPGGDTDFRVERLVGRHDHDLANGLGNLASRLAGLLRRLPAERRTAVSARTGAAALDEGIAKQIDKATARLDFRTATALLWELV